MPHSFLSNIIHPTHHDKSLVKDSEPSQEVAVQDNSLSIPDIGSSSVVVQSGTTDADKSRKDVAQATHQHESEIAHHDPALLGIQDNPLYPSPHAPGGGSIDQGTGTSSNAIAVDGKHHASTKAFIGKMEHALGTLLHSQSLTMKGTAMEKEASEIRNQQHDADKKIRGKTPSTYQPHTHDKDAKSGIGAAPTNVGEIGQASQGIGGIGGSGATRVF